MWRIEYRATDRLQPGELYALGTATYPTLAEALVQMAIRILNHRKEVNLRREQPEEDILLVARLRTFLPWPTSFLQEASPSELLRRLMTQFEDAALSCGDSSPKTPTETAPSEPSRPSESSGSEGGTL